MSHYVIKYEYYTFEACGDGCCHDSESAIEIYEEDRTSYLSSFNVPVMEDEYDLQKFIDNNCPEYSDFRIHPDTRWF